MNEDLLIAIKNLLKSSRLKAKLSYKQLAILSKISDQTLRSYENNPSTDISFNKLIHLLKLSHVTTEDVIKLFKLFY